MLNRRFVEEVFTPQELYSGPALRIVFDKLAHASIMRLNPPSMDKVRVAEKKGIAWLMRQAGTRVLGVGDDVRSLKMWQCVMMVEDVRGVRKCE